MATRYTRDSHANRSSRILNSLQNFMLCRTIVITSAPSGGPIDYVWYDNAFTWSGAGGVAEYTEARAVGAAVMSACPHGSVTPRSDGRRWKGVFREEFGREDALQEVLRDFWNP
jgi:hypothetical protein